MKTLFAHALPIVLCGHINAAESPAWIDNRSLPSDPPESQGTEEWRIEKKEAEKPRRNHYCLLFPFSFLSAIHERFDNLIWMKLSELARYRAARECTTITNVDRALHFHAPWACQDFTVQVSTPHTGAWRYNGAQLEEVPSVAKLKSGTWSRRGDKAVVCLNLAKGQSSLTMHAE